MGAERSKKTKREGSFEEQSRISMDHERTLKKDARTWHRGTGRGVTSTLCLRGGYFRPGRARFNAAESQLGNRGKSDVGGRFRKELNPDSRKKAVHLKDKIRGHWKNTFELEGGWPRGEGKTQFCLTGLSVIGA